MNNKWRDIGLSPSLGSESNNIHSAFPRSLRGIWVATRDALNLDFWISVCLQSRSINKSERTAYLQSRDNLTMTSLRDASSQPEESLGSGLDRQLDRFQGKLLRKHVTDAQMFNNRYDFITHAFVCLICVVNCIFTLIISTSTSWCYYNAINWS